MSSGSRTSRPQPAARRSSAGGAHRAAMSELQLAAYLAARDAVRRANRISLLLPYRSRQEISASGSRRPSL